MSFDPSLEGGFRNMFKKDSSALLKKVREVSFRDTDAKSSKKPQRKRFVFRHWPRDINGGVIDRRPGKRTPNEIIWGATLFDFYMVYRMPEVAGWISFNSGSSLAEWMKEHGELDFAKDELLWAEREANPQLVSLPDFCELISENDMMSSLSLGKPLAREINHIEDANPPFDLASYPAPWPFVPFTTLPLKLQDRIPLHLLPETLVVHDPYGVLPANGAHDQTAIDSTPKTIAANVDETIGRARTVFSMPQSTPEQDARWAKGNDIVWTYKLDLSSSTNEASQRTSQELRDPPASEQKPYLMLYSDPDDETGLSLPAIVVPAPKHQPLLSIPEAHLYINPSSFTGRGNHSFVYDVEWELPRSLFYEPVYCVECLWNDVSEVMKKEDKELWRVWDEYRQSREDHGRSWPPEWRNLRSTADVEKPSPTAESVTPGEAKEMKMGKVTHEDEIVQPGETVEIQFEHEITPGVSTTSDTPIPGRTFDISDPVTRRTTHYEGPTHFFPVDVKLQYPHSEGPCCAHTSAGRPKRPLTVTVRVAAKLSIKDDEHLEHEAENYQKFPQHFFEHWSGFNLIQPIRNPVPVGALVPQFYGYYTPAMDTAAAGKAKYLSPILLLEDCGTPIDPATLGIDDRQECGSLLLRFHHEGWDHHSFYPRNILMQPGPLKEFPDFRNNKQRSFRLIDFGRSTYDAKDSNKNHTDWEKNEAFKLLGIGGYYEHEFEERS